MQTLANFLKGKDPDASCTPVDPTYRPGVRYADLTKCLPAFVTDAMREALPRMASKLKGFDMDTAVMTGVETRSSSPVRISRDRETMKSINTQGMYPGGEGAGYAGGIMSAAVDGIKIAEKIIENFNAANGAEE